MSMLYPTKEETSKHFSEGMRAVEERKKLEEIRKKLESNFVK